MRFLDLLVLAEDLINNEHENEAKQREVDDVVSETIKTRLFMVFQSVAHPVYHTNQVSNERKELSLDDLLLVEIPIRLKKTVHKSGLKNSLICRAVQNLDQTQEASLISYSL